MPDGSNFASQCVSTEDLAEVLGVTARRVRQLGNEGVLHQSGRDEWPLGVNVRAYHEYRVKVAQAERGSDRDRLARAQAQKVEMENLRRRGELYPAEMVLETLQVIAAAIVAQRLGQAGRLANELAAITDPAIVRERVLDDWRVAILPDLERVFEDRAIACEAVEEGGDDPEAAAETNAGSVGGREPDVPRGEPGAGAISRASHALLHPDSGGVRGAALSASGSGDGHPNG